MEAYNRLNDYYKKLFGERTLKICINGHFTCPNRDGTKGREGCIFCYNGGSLINGDSPKKISEQIEDFLLSYKGERANKFIAYFQEYTNTYGSIEELKKKYDEALNASPNFVGLDIDTRPDCINESVCELISSYNDKYHVFVELGLQTSNENTHRLLNQNITNDDVRNACALLKKYNIETIVHLMIGLPNETHDDIVKTVEFINELNVEGIKIHSTYILKDTKLALLYEKGEYIPLSKDDYIDEVIYILTYLRKDMIIHRITGDAPSSLLIGPSWANNKKVVMNEINRIMSYSNLYQGKYYRK